MKFLDARSQAENARQVLDEALKSPNSEVKPPIENVTIPIPEAITESVSESIESVTSDDLEPAEVENNVESNADDLETVTAVDDAIVEIPVSKSTKKK
jgi:hypothetical protein